jgi:hypothetical protein
MPAIIAMLWGALFNIIGSRIGRALVALGIGVVTYTGFNVMLGTLKNNAFSAIGNLPSGVLDILLALKVGPALGIIFSAVTARLVISGLTSDSVKRFVKK